MGDSSQTPRMPAGATFERAAGAARRLFRRPLGPAPVIVDRASLSQLSWGQVRRLLDTAYRQRGYEVQEVVGEAPVDMVLRRGDETVFVGCRHWNVWEVGERVVRDIWGYANGAGAGHATVLTTGQFTKGARAFARDHDLELVDGAAVLALVA